MHLELDRFDMNPWERHNIPTSKVAFNHFQIRVQVAIRAVGRAIFYEDDRSNYNAVYPPKDD